MCESGGGLVQVTQVDDSSDQSVHSGQCIGHVFVYVCVGMGGVGVAPSNSGNGSVGSNQVTLCHTYKYDNVTHNFV